MRDQIDLEIAGQRHVPMVGFDWNHMFEKGARPGRTVEAPFGRALMSDKQPIHLTWTNPYELAFQLFGDGELFLDQRKPLRRGRLEALRAQIARDFPDFGERGDGCLTVSERTLATTPVSLRLGQRTLQQTDGVLAVIATVPSKLL